MKLFFTFFILLTTINTYSQHSADTCCSNFKLPNNNNDGFDQDVRLDTAGKSFLLQLNLKNFRYVNDFTGSLGSPGLLFNELNFSSYELLSANLSFSDKNNAQKILFAPFKLNPSIRSNLLLNTRVNFALKDKIMTIGAAIGGDNSDAHIKRFDSTRKAIFEQGIYCTPECYSDKDKQEEARQKNQEEANNELIAFNKARTKSVFKWSLGYNVQLFQVLSSKSDDPAIDSLNHFALKAYTVSLSLSYGINNGSWVFSGGYNYIHGRKAADKSEKEIPYHGVQLFVTKRLFQFIGEENLKTNDNYLKSLFIPSLNLGISYEYKTTNGDVKFVEDGIQRSRVITPFIDILISPASQFRIGIPISRNKSVVDQKSMEVGSVLQYSFKLTNLN